MMLCEELIKIKISNPNKKHYSSILKRELRTGEELLVEQKHLPKSARNEVKCKCDICGLIFTRVRKDIKEKTYCSSDCRNKNLISVNPSNKIKKN